MDHFRRIYSGDAAAYQRMIAAEDADGHLASFLRERVRDLPGRKICDLGGGTGRFGMMLAPLSDRFLSVDLHEAMLLEQDRGRRAGGPAAARWWLVRADMRRLPLPDGWADAVLAGWSIGHFSGWYPDDWETEVDRVLAEMERLATPGGLLCVCETMTTGSLTPAPPTPGLAAYYRRLEQIWGFTPHVLATDYQFESVEAAVSATEFFFGEELSRTIRRQGWSRVPEWTGVWLKRAPDRR